MLTAEAGTGQKLDNDVLEHWSRKVRMPLGHIVLKNVNKLSVLIFIKVLAHNLSPSTLGSKRYGVLVPLTYKQLVPDATKEQMDKAHILGNYFLIKAFL